jgi:hypothetical protein
MSNSSIFSIIIVLVLVGIFSVMYRANVLDKEDEEWPLIDNVLYALAILGPIIFPCSGAVLLGNNLFGAFVGFVGYFAFMACCITLKPESKIKKKMKRRIALLDTVSATTR